MSPPKIPYAGSGFSAGECILALGECLIPDLVVIGSLNMDLTVRVSRLPGAGETVFGTDFYQAPGGKGGNQAVAASRLGAGVRIAARIGRDAFGEALKQGLDAEGVDVAAIAADDGPTGVALIIVEATGQNQIAVVAGANGRLTSEDVDQVHWDARLWAVAQLEVPDEAIIRGFSRARTGGGRTILNAAPARPLSLQLWALTDLLVVNETEAALIAGQPVGNPAAALAAARRLQARGPSTVAVTLGSEGSVLVSKQHAWHVPAISVEAVDATAAGDAWVGALATALTQGGDLLSAATFASAAGALAVTRPGAQPSLPRRDETHHLAASVAPARRLF